MADIKISALAAAGTITPGTDVLPLVSGASTTKATPLQVVTSVLTTGSAIAIGLTTAANTTRFPNALSISSKITGAANLALIESHNIGVVGEGLAHSTITTIYGIGVYGVGYTNAATRCGGVVGEAHVNASTDAGSAIGVRGYSNDVHSGGMNIGLYGDAAGSTATAGTTGNNLSLYLNNGDIYSLGAKTWYLGGNLTFTNAYTVTTAGTGLGYSTGAGGAVTQGTSRTTPVTLNKASGAITLFTAIGSITPSTFIVNNTTVAATDTIIVNCKSSTNVYLTFVTAIAANSFNITFYTTGGVTSDTPVFNFTVIKGVAA